MILQGFARVVLRMKGWKITGQLPGSKCVVAMAPHTSNTDFLVGWLGYTALGIQSHFLIKKEAFKWYTSALFKAMGGIPVDRRNSTNIVLKVTEEFEKRDRFIVTITPEGTRKLNKHWKRGYYFIALNAHVPIALGYLDYKLKEGGFGPSFYPSGDFEADFKKIEEFYRGKHAHHPERFNLTE